MIITNIGETVTGSITELKTEGFKIANTAHMMEILSKRLYTNPELAVCRELVCNAIDSHVAAGTQQPVEVTLPNALNDFVFIVKDFGTGLSEEDVMSLYTTYGASSKQSSNDFIGCLGIGSKSPFAVTEEFSVVSRFNGNATTYHCYKQQGVPVCTKLSCVPTDEHNGMTITVPFKSGSIRNFNKYAADFFKGVNKSLVKVYSEEPVSFYEDTQVMFRYKNILVKPSEDYSEDTFVRMGQVLYKVPREWRRFIKGLTSCGDVILEVPIGSFTIAANREFLEENEENRQKFTKIVEDLRDEFLTVELPKKIGNARTYRTFNKMLEHDNGLFYCRQTVMEKAKAKKIDLTSSFNFGMWVVRNKTVRKYTSESSPFLEKNAVHIYRDVAPVVEMSTLLKYWDNSKVGERTSYIYFRDKTPTFQFDKVVFVSQLNDYYNAQVVLRKRRQKSSQKKVRTDSFTLYKFGRNSSIRYKCYSKDLEESVVPYVVFKRLKPVGDSENYIELMYQHGKNCYGISQGNAKNLPESYVPLDEYVESIQKDFEDEDYKSHRNTALDNLMSHSRGYVPSGYRSLLGNKFLWLYNFPVIPAYTPRTASDRMLQKCCETHNNYEKFLTSVSKWFNFYNYDEAPEKIRAYVNKLFKDMVESCESSTKTK